MWHAQTFRVDLYELGVCCDPAGAIVDLADGVNGDQHVTVETESERWTFDVGDVSERRIDPHAVRRDGRLVSLDDVPHWLEAALDFVGCRLPKESQA